LTNVCSVNRLIQVHIYPHTIAWVASERADCKPINSVIANSWVYAETH